MQSTDLKIFIGPVGMHFCTCLASALKEKGIMVACLASSVLLYRAELLFSIKSSNENMVGRRES